MPPRTAPTRPSTTDDDATRLIRADRDLSELPAGFADIILLSLASRTRYAYDPRHDPQLQWAGKAEHLTFNVETVPLYIHERVAPAAISDILHTGPVQRRAIAAGLVVQMFAAPSTIASPPTTVAWPSSAASTSSAYARTIRADRQVYPI